MKIITYTYNEKRTVTGESGTPHETIETTRTHTIDMHETLTRCAHLFRHFTDLATTIYGPLLQRINIGAARAGSAD